MGSLSFKEPCPGCGKPLCNQPTEFCERSEISRLREEVKRYRQNGSGEKTPVPDTAEITRLKEEVAALKKRVSESGKMVQVRKDGDSSGILINRHATVSANVVSIQERLSYLEKAYKKDPKLEPVFHKLQKELGENQEEKKILREELINLKLLF